jgi:hypothetical protein
MLPYHIYKKKKKRKEKKKKTKIKQFLTTIFLFQKDCKRIPMCNEKPDTKKMTGRNICRQTCCGGVVILNTVSQSKMRSPASIMDWKTNQVNG